MYRILASLLALGLLVVTLTADTSAGDKTEKKAEKKAEKKKEAPQIPFVKRGSEHKLLTTLVGNFDAKVKFYADPSKPAIETTGSLARKMILDGNYLQENFKGKFFDKAFAGQGTIGYDFNKKQFVMTWVDNMSTSMALMNGTYDMEKKTFTFLGDEIDPKNGKKMKARDVLKIVSADEQQFEMYRQPEGSTEEIKMMDISYTRAKKVEKKKEEKKKEEKKTDNK